MEPQPSSSGYATTSPLNAVVLCPMCGSMVSQAIIYIHIPVCYRAWATANGGVPLCTCNDCGGTRTHSSGGPYGGQLGASPRAGGPSTPLSAKQQALGLGGWTQLPLLQGPNGSGVASPGGGASSSSTPTRGGVSDLHVYTGRCCVLCNTKRSPANCPLPRVHIGRDKTLLLCKKGHIQSEEDQARLVALIDEFYASLAEHGEKKPSTGLEGSEEEEEEEEAVGDGALYECAGYRTVNGALVKCGKTINDLLWIENREGQKLCFCGARHLLRYLVYHYGKKVVTKQTATATTSTSTSTATTAPDRKRPREGE
ncbi:hypothetical protein QOT17_006901 [Balamuthia mandrillaris]